MTVSWQGVVQGREVDCGNIVVESEGSKFAGMRAAGRDRLTHEGQRNRNVASRGRVASIALGTTKAAIHT